MFTRRSSGPASVKGLDARYIVVLLLIAFLSLGSFGLLESVIASQKTSAAEINYAGRQRMLLQRVNYLRSQIDGSWGEHDRSIALREFSLAVNMMSRSHKGLTEGDASLGLSPPASDELRARYFGPVSFIHRDLTAFFEVANDYMLEVHAGGSAAEHSRLLRKLISPRLRADLDGVVAQYQQDTEVKVSALQNLQAVTVAVVLGVLLFSGLFVFRPMVVRLKKDVADLAEAEERFRSITESSEMAMVIAINDGGNIIAWNPAAERTFGYREEEIIGKTLKTLIPERYQGAHQMGFNRAVKSGELRNAGKTIELQAVHRDGHEFPIELSLGTWQRHGRRYFSSIIHDISERKKSEKLNIRLGRIIEHAVNEIYVFNAETLELISANQGGRDNLGYSMEELSGMSVLDFNPDFDKAGFEKLIAPLWEGRRERVILNSSLLRKDGSSYQAEIILQMIRTESPPVVLGFVTDVTERKALEDSLRRSQKMEAVGQLAGGIAHDFNNILGIISGNLTLLNRKAELDERNAKRVETSMRAVNRAAALTTELLGFTRLDAARSATVNINDVLRDMFNLVEQSASKSVTKQVNLADDLWLTDIDAGELQDAVVNLCVNAGHAMPDGGTLTIETENRKLSVAESGMVDDLREKEFVLLTVTDTGCGIPDDQIDNIFEPFFTTKEKGRGTGLGLALVFGFVRRSKGEIKVDSKVGEGTKFEIYLPRSSSEKVGETAAPVEDTPVRGGDEFVLVVDDEPELAAVAEQYLSEAGYRVAVATSGQEALNLLAANPDIQLVFSDVVMPGGITGFDLAIRAIKKRPNIKVILTSGYTSESERSRIKNAYLARQLSTALLEKPYSRNQALTRVRQALDEEIRWVWTKDLETGIDVVDEDHRVIISMLNRFCTALSMDDKDVSPDIVRQIANDILSFSKDHFDREEAVMEFCGAPELEVHKEMHRRCLGQLSNNVGRLDGADFRAGAESLMKFLSGWLIEHIAEMDMELRNSARDREDEIRAHLEVNHQGAEIGG